MSLNIGLSGVEGEHSRGGQRPLSRYILGLSTTAARNLFDSFQTAPVTSDRCGCGSLAFLANPPLLSQYGPKQSRYRATRLSDRLRSRASVQRGQPLSGKLLYTVAFRTWRTHPIEQ